MHLSYICARFGKMIIEEYLFPIQDEGRKIIFEIIFRKVFSNQTPDVLLPSQK